MSVTVEITCDFPGCEDSIHVHTLDFDYEDLDGWLPCGNQHYCPTHADCLADSQLEIISQEL